MNTQVNEHYHTSRSKQNMHRAWTWLFCTTLQHRGSDTTSDAGYRQSTDTLLDAQSPVWQSDLGASFGVTVDASAEGGVVEWAPPGLIPMLSSHSE